MTEIRLHSRENPDGTFTYHAKCQLDSVTDMSGNTVDNPVRTIVWDTIQNKYVVKEESNDGLVIEDASSDDDVYDVTTNDQTNDSFLGRECWCARIFHNHQPDFEMDDVLRITDEASFCPIDTNSDGVTSRRDVRVCDARAVIDRYGHILSKDQQCHSQLPIAEFAKSTWPLCFFWWILLVYMLCGTHYGSRVMGFIKRTMLLKCIGLKKLVFVSGDDDGGDNGDNGDNGDETLSQQRRGRTPNEQSSTQAEEGITEVARAATTREQHPSQDGVPRNVVVDNEDRNNNNDEGQGGSGSAETITPSDDETRSNNDSPASSDSPGQRRRPDPPEHRSIPPPPPPPLPPPRSEIDVQDGSEWSGNNLEAIEREFGSYDNYLILDNELRRQSNASNNEFVTWLWYSAVYTEVRRYRYERWLQRRERERFRRLGRTPSEEAEDNDYDDDDDDVAPGLLGQGSRRLDSVFWWPPSGPDGSRWEHLRSNNNNNNNQIRTNEDGCPIDQTRLCLKTKRFLPEDSSSTESTNNDTTPPTTSAQEETKVSDYVVPEVSENTCSICLCELEEGDLVGDIPCGHFFHKDCLKEWLTKNNHCPICRMENIASHPVKSRPPCRRLANANGNGNSPTTESVV